MYMLVLPGYRATALVRRGMSLKKMSRKESDDRPRPALYRIFPLGNEATH